MLVGPILLSDRIAAGGSWLSFSFVSGVNAREGKTLIKQFPKAEACPPTHMSKATTVFIQTQDYFPPRYIIKETSGPQLKFAYKLQLCPIFFLKKHVYIFLGGGHLSFRVIFLLSKYSTRGSTGLRGVFL